jgi:hypothetical protein
LGLLVAFEFARLLEGDELVHVALELVEDAHTILPPDLR